MITANKAKSTVFKVDLNAEDMRLLLTKQKDARLANGIPDYATRIDGIDCPFDFSCRLSNLCFLTNKSADTLNARRNS
jgi:hypothetical protein